MKLKGWLKEAKEKVSSIDAELIAVAAFGFVGRTDIVLHWDDEYDTTEADKLVEKRISGMPMAYILGYKEFYGREFMVNPSVLIPRPETESIITSVLGIVDVEKLKDVTIVDVGTGSGCIPITLKLELNSEDVLSEISAVDISEPALETAQENATKLLADVKFFRSDLLSEVEGLPDIITANLPYVDMSWDWTSPDLKFEPALALYAEDGGLIYINKLIDDIHERRMKEIEESTVSDMASRFLILEADTSQHDIIIKYAKERKFELISKDDFIITFRY